MFVCIKEDTTAYNDCMCPLNSIFESRIHLCMYRVHEVSMAIAAFVKTVKTNYDTSYEVSGAMAMGASGGARVFTPQLCVSQCCFYCTQYLPKPPMAIRISLVPSLIPRPTGSVEGGLVT